MDQNQKFVVTLDDGLQVETVWYPGETLCLSSQAGCAIGCPFCASGQLGLRRNLTPDELEKQLQACYKQGIEPKRLTISGIGEPLHNLANLSCFIQKCRERDLPVSITTTGSPLKRVADLIRLPHNGIMFSLHSAVESTHTELIPNGPGTTALRAEIERIWPQLSRRQRRRIGFNYLLLSGINDNQEQLQKLAEWLAPFSDATLHLLSCNPVEGSTFSSPDNARIDEIHEFFRRSTINVRRANRWRRQAQGGCGTLVLGQERQRSSLSRQESQ